MARAYLGLGSNLGNRFEHIEWAVQALARHGTVLARSPLIETEPVDCFEGGRFVNACLCLDTQLGAVALLEASMKIEQARGRTRNSRNAPRTLDVDLLLVDDKTVTGPALTIPHPRMHKRRFVLEPLAAIAPGITHPVLGLTARGLLELLGSQEGVSV